ncbi:MAG: hypothetical protein U0R68_15715 [Candidatus Nanopelagicales bacterium]
MAGSTKVLEGIDVRIDVFGFMGGSNGPSDTAPPGLADPQFKGLASWQFDRGAPGSVEEQGAAEVARGLVAPKSTEA